MANISFTAPPPTAKPEPSTAEQPAAEVVDVEATVTEVSQPADKSDTLVVSEPKPLATQSVSPPKAPGVSGEVSISDIKLPRINLVQKVGGLADNFTPGSILFEKTVVLSDGKTPFDMTPLQIHKKYQRKVAWGEGDGEAPETYNTLAEVRAAGGSTIWGDENYFQEVADIQVAIPCPEGADDAGVTDLFPYEFAGKHYAVAIWTVSSSGYTALAKPLITASVSLLRNGLFTGHYNVASEIRKNAKNSWYAPTATFAGKHTPEAAEFFKQIAGL
jgi:hypothetical protein